MLSKSKIKTIQSLGRKKSRHENDFFLVEGNKMTKEVLMSEFQIETLVATYDFLKQNDINLNKVKEIIEVEKTELKKASLLQNPQDALAIVKQLENKNPAFDFNKQLIIVLDFIQDPGNLGTILRISDWFGIDGIICSENTVDIYNPKVVQASMGAIFRQKVWYTELEEFFSGIDHSKFPVYGTFMNGENIYTKELCKNGFLVFGNEGNGISSALNKFINIRLNIPSFKSSDISSESLNVAIATAICCSEFKRR